MSSVLSVLDFIRWSGVFAVAGFFLLLLDWYIRHELRRRT